MGYQTRARRFSFMGVDSTARGYDVVQEKDDFAVLPDRPKVAAGTFNGTLTMSLAEFARRLYDDEPTCELVIG